MNGMVHPRAVTVLDKRHSPGPNAHRTLTLEERDRDGNVTGYVLVGTWPETRAEVFAQLRAAMDQIEAEERDALATPEATS